jgi:hypothetical protein
VEWESVGEDTESSYSTCLHEISQNASRKNTDIEHGSPIALNYYGSRTPQQFTFYQSIIIFDTITFYTIAPPWQGSKTLHRNLLFTNLCSACLLSSKSHYKELHNKALAAQVAT